MVKIHLGQKTISDNSRPYVIAEIGVNHEGSLDQAKRLIELAKEGGADAAKFQSYKAETISSKNSPSYWDLSKEPMTSQYLLFKKYDSFGPEEYRLLAEHCHEVGIDFLSTPFDDHAIDFLDPLVPFFKIASADLTNAPFLRKVAAKKKPVVLSTGASTVSEIDQAIFTLEKAGCSEIALLHCILNYPTPDHCAHLKMISHLKRSYEGYVTGYSDHTLPDEHMTSLVTSYVLGARIIEKHFTHDKSLPGNDHYHAMDAKDCRVFVDQVAKIDTLLGKETHKKPIPSEALSRKNARRSIVVSRPIKAGQILGENDLTYKRPGSGISPLHWDDVIGKTTGRDLEEDALLAWQDLK